jgi:hypothetical protein
MEEREGEGPRVHVYDVMRVEVRSGRAVMELAHAVRCGLSHVVAYLSHAVHALRQEVGASAHVAAARAVTVAAVAAAAVATLLV